MSDYNITNLGDGIDFLSCSADRFKTNETSICITSPLKSETASVNALVSGLICRCSKEYPDLSALNKECAMLYGAQIVPTVSKSGDFQTVKIGMTSIDDRFSLEHSSISEKCLKLMLSLLFEPKLDEIGLFCRENIETEKRILREKLEAEVNEKRTYALRRTEEIMFSGEPYSINRYGTIESIDAITPQDATAAWKELLKKAKILITSVGSADEKSVCDLIKSKFDSVDRQYTPLGKSTIKSINPTLKEACDRLDVKQGKLVLGFRVNLDADDKLTCAMRSFSDVFGGGPYSRLFMNVREKMSLCYYCSARYYRQKGAIIVQCGCEEENMDKAVKEIKNQLELIAKGEFDSELQSSKMAITDALMSVYDDPNAIEIWYTAQNLDREYKTPKDSAAENDSVTKEDVVRCASLLSLDTIYRLVSTGEGE